MNSTGRNVSPSCVCVQVLSVTRSAEYCEQYVAYACRMSRLLNTPGKVSDRAIICRDVTASPATFQSLIKYRAYLCMQINH